VRHDKHKDRCPTCGRRNRRSNPQNALYWVLLHLAAARTWSGQTYSADQFHLYYRSKYLGCDDVTIPGGKVMSIPRSTAALDVAEFSEYYGKVEADLAERDVYLHELPP
jgi:hypothetical protein